MSLYYMLLIVATLVLGMGSQAFIKHTYIKWSKVPTQCGLSGAEVARRVLDANGLAAVKIQPISGELTDNFNPSVNILSLSKDNYYSTSVAACAVAAHEAGHAIQKAVGYSPMKLRTALAPAMSFVSNLWIFILMFGLFMNTLGFIYVAIACYVVAVLFQFITLPVEFDASRRALACINGPILVGEEQQGAETVLRAAAWTYVAAALASVLQLLYILGMARN